jgi:hypothetical protein
MCKVRQIDFEHNVSQQLYCLLIEPGTAAFVTVLRVPSRNTSLWWCHECHEECHQDESAEEAVKSFVTDVRHPRVCCRPGADQNAGWSDLLGKYGVCHHDCSHITSIEHVLEVYEADSMEPQMDDAVCCYSASDFIAADVSALQLRLQVLDAEFFPFTDDVRYVAVCGNAADGGESGAWALTKVSTTTEGYDVVVCLSSACRKKCTHTSKASAHVITRSRPRSAGRRERDGDQQWNIQGGVSDELRVPACVYSDQSIEEDVTEETSGLQHQQQQVIAKALAATRTLRLISGNGITQLAVDTERPFECDHMIGSVWLFDTVGAVPVRVEGDNVDFKFIDRVVALRTRSFWFTHRMLQNRWNEITLGVGTYSKSLQLYCLRLAPSSSSSAQSAYGITRADADILQRRAMKGYIAASVSYQLLQGIDYSEEIGGDCAGGCQDLVIDGVNVGFQSQRMYCETPHRYASKCDDMDKRPVDGPPLRVPQVSSLYMTAGNVNLEKITSYFFKLSRPPAIFIRKKRKTQTNTTMVSLEDVISVQPHMLTISTNQQFPKLTTLMLLLRDVKLQGANLILNNIHDMRLMKALTCKYPLSSLLPHCVVADMKGFCGGGGEKGTPHDVYMVDDHGNSTLYTWVKTEGDSNGNTNNNSDNNDNNNDGGGGGGGEYVQTTLQRSPTSDADALTDDIRARFNHHCPLLMDWIDSRTRGAGLTIGKFDLTASEMYLLRLIVSRADDINNNVDRIVKCDSTGRALFWHPQQLRDSRVDADAAVDVDVTVGDDVGAASASSTAQFQPTADAGGACFSTLQCYPKHKHLYAKVGLYAADVGATSLASCNHHMHQPGKSTAGVFTVFCMTCVRMIGFHVMPNAESERVMFDWMMSRGLCAPRYVCYDIACNLHRFCMSREPVFFRDTVFVQDDLHKGGHWMCSHAYHTDAHRRLDKRNTQRCEQSNSRHTKAHKNSLYYMGQTMFLWHLRMFFYLKERAKKQKSVNTSPVVLT